MPALHWSVHPQPSVAGFAPLEGHPPGQGQGRVGTGDQAGSVLGPGQTTISPGWRAECRKASGPLLVEGHLWMTRALGRGGRLSSMRQLVPTWHSALMASVPFKPFSVAPAGKACHRHRWLVHRELPQPVPAWSCGSGNCAVRATPLGSLGERALSCGAPHFSVQAPTPLRRGLVRF